MGGLATAIAAGMLALVFLQAFSLFFGGMTTESSMMINSNQDQASILSTRLNERIAVTSLSVVNQTCVVVNVQNTGGIAIPARSLGLMDLILIYTPSTGATPQSVWLPYTPSGHSLEGWMVTNVTSAAGRAPDVSPINYPAATHGSWEPSETVQITVWVPASAEIDASKALSVALATPGGAEAFFAY